MPFKSYFSILISLLLLFPCITFAMSEYNYISAGDLESRLKAEAPANILDIQVEEEFSRHHIKGAIPTYAYPVKNDIDHAKLDSAITQLNTNSDPVVIVCPRGGGGAKRTYDYLLQQKVSEDRLLILEKGQGGWAYPSLTESD